ncbi:MAG: hypothetical protein KDA66_17850, partial [Planctomycetaceae bacterium]|nr:hypothetical protein [Planctomycetaceae bacterium]
MSDARLLRRVDEVVVRLRRLRSARAMAIGFGVLTLLVGMCLVFPAFVSLAWPLFLAGLLAVVLVGFLIGSDKQTARVEAVRLIEKVHPELDARLKTAMGFDWDAASGGYTYLQQEVIDETMRQSVTQRWTDVVPASQLWMTRILSSFAFLFCLMMGLEAFQNIPAAPASVTGNDPAAETINEQQPVGGSLEISVDPGDTEVERGTGLLVMASFTGGPLPEQVALVTTDDEGEKRTSLKQSLNDPLFGGRLSEVSRDLTYFVEYDGVRSPEYKVTTFELPNLLQADAQLNYPEYTGLQPRSIEDVRRVSAVEGTDVTWICHLNKPVASAKLVADDDTELLLEPVAVEEGTAPQMRVTWRAEGLERHKFKLQLTDSDGRTNREPPSFIVEVVPNRPPELKVAFPAHDLRVSPLQEVSLQANATDDFGLNEYGVVLQLPSGEESTLPLNENAEPVLQSEMAHTLALEALGTVPNDLISYFFYAEDIGPDGQPRRAYSDLFF